MREVLLVRNVLVDCNNHLVSRLLGSRWQFAVVYAT